MNCWTIRLDKAEVRWVQTESLARWVEASFPKQVIASLQSKSVLRRTSDPAGMIHKISAIWWM